MSTFGSNEKVTAERAKTLTSREPTPLPQSPIHDSEEGSLEFDIRRQDEPEKYQRSTGFRWFAICVALYSSCLLYGLDQTIVANIQGAVIKDFGEVPKLGWLGIGFPLGSIATTLSLGKAFGIFNVKWLYVSSLVMFAAGSALCGAAPSMNALIIGRVWAGAGGAGVYLGLLNMLSLETAPKERPVYIGLGTGVMWGTGCILGPVIGGSFSESSATWRWAFYINLVIFGVCSPIYLFLLTSFQPQKHVAFVQKLKSLDWTGVVLNAAVYTTFVMVFTFGGATWAWGDSRTITLFVIFGIVLGLFIIQQYFSLLTTPECRLFPGDFLHDRSLILLYIGTACASTGLLIPIYYVPLFFQFAHGDNGIVAAVRLLPFICITIFTITLNGFAMPKLGYYMPWYAITGLFLTVGGALMYALVDATTPISTIYGFTVLIAFGAGASQTAAYSIAPTLVAPAHLADAVAFINVGQIGAGVLALTITSTVFQNRGVSHLKAALAAGFEPSNFSDSQVRAALAGAQSAVFEDASPELRLRVVDAVVRAIGDGYLLVIAAGAVGLVAAMFMRREKVFLKD